MTAVEESLQDCLLPIGDEWIRTEKADTIRLPYDNSPVAVVAQGDPALVSRAAKAARQAAGQLLLVEHRCLFEFNRVNKFPDVHMYKNVSR